MTDLDIVRDWVGSTPDDTAVNATLARWPDDTAAPQKAALSILRRRLADLEADPATMAIDGDISWSTAQDQRQAIRAKIRSLEAAVGDTTTTSLTPPLTSAPIVGPGNLR